MTELLRIVELGPDDNPGIRIEHSDLNPGFKPIAPPLKIPSQTKKYAIIQQTEREHRGSPAFAHVDSRQPPSDKRSRMAPRLKSEQVTGPSVVHEKIGGKQCHQAEQRDKPADFVGHKQQEEPVPPWNHEVKGRSGTNDTEDFCLAHPGSLFCQEVFRHRSWLPPTYRRAPTRAAAFSSTNSRAAAVTRSCTPIRENTHPVNARA